MILDTKNIINLKDHGVHGDKITDDTLAIQSVYDMADREKDVVYFPPGFVCRVTGTIYPKGITTIGSCSEKRLGRNSDFLSGVIADIPKSSVTVTGTDLLFEKSSVASVTTDLSVFNDGDLLIVEGGTGNEYKVGTVKGSPTARLLLFREGAAPPLFLSDHSGSSCTLTKLVPVFEDGVDIAGRQSPDGTVFKGIGIAGTSEDKTSGWQGAISPTSYVIGYKGGVWDQTTFDRDVNTRGQFDIRCKHIAVGVTLTGWQNDIDVYCDHCCVGFAGYQMHANDIKLDSDACGTHRVKGMTGGRLLFHHQGSDDWWTQQAYFRDVGGADITIRTEGSTTSKRWLEFQFISGSHVTMHCGSIGAIAQGDNHIEVNNSSSCIFLGKITAGTGVGGDIRFGSQNNDIAYLFAGSPRINGSTNATKLI